MTGPSKKDLVQLYNDRFDELGYDIKTVGWSSVQSQQLRFKILSEVASLSNSSILDVGCGLGDLYPYLSGSHSNINFSGIDISSKLVRDAAQRHPKASFEVRDLLENPLKEESYDYVLSSGALSFKLENHNDYIAAMLSEFYKTARKAVAVNFLSSYADFMLEKNFHFVPEDAFKLGKSLTKWVSIRADYPLYEFTLYLYKEPIN